MKSIRLLPVVIFAALALLVFKGVGLVTNGGYVLTGPVAVAANEAAPAAEGEGGETAAPSEAMLTDTSPTLGDTAPTIATKAEAAGGEHGSASSGEHGGASGESSAPVAEGEHGTSSAASSSTEEAAVVCPETGAPKPEAHGGDGLTDKIGNALANGCPSAEIPVNENGDALPTTKDGNGKIVPLAVAEGDDSETALLGRLSERRSELDKREADLVMRTALVEAAEKRLDERTKELAALQAQVTAMVDEKQVTEDEGFKAIVSMYENMKPKEAAKIFDTLDIEVLLRVTRAMNPRKMSPILAAMSTKPAEELTTALASKAPLNTVADAGENLANLPQIVGK